jgi:hypothetical protein
VSFDKIKLVKFVASSIVGLGTGKIVGRIIKNNITPETLIEKVTVTAAAWVIAGVVTKATKQYTDETIDDLVENVTGIIDKIKTAEKLTRVSKGQSTFEDEGLDPNQYEKNDSGKWVRIPTIDEVVGYDRTTKDKMVEDLRNVVDQIARDLTKNDYDKLEAINAVIDKLDAVD